MNWTEPKPPTDGVSYYDHTTLLTPLGEFMIDWKSWKERPSYSVMLNDDWLGEENSLESAKEMAKDYIILKHKELELFLSK